MRSDRSRAVRRKSHRVGREKRTLSIVFYRQCNSKRSHAASQNVMPCGLRKVGLVNSPHAEELKKQGLL
ncbi:MAG: hypothetical protein IKA96_08070 [Alistipes sp.]|nr:hypothetical protein [Alistipes sp.]